MELASLTILSSLSQPLSFIESSNDELRAPHTQTLSLFSSLFYLHDPTRKELHFGTESNQLSLSISLTLLAKSERESPSFQMKSHSFWLGLALAAFWTSQAKQAPAASLWFNGIYGSFHLKDLDLPPPSSHPPSCHAPTPTHTHTHTHMAFSSVHVNMRMCV